MGTIRDISVFLASPSDVAIERQRIERVVLRLNQRFAGLARFRVIRYEHGFYSVHRHPQDQITEPGDCDVVIAFFGGRLGSPMQDDFSKRMEGDKAYPSGTAYELLSAIAAAKANNGRPAVYLFQSTAEPQFRLSETAEREAAQREKQRLEAFLRDQFTAPDGQPRRVIYTFADPDDLANQVNELLLQWAGLSLRNRPAWLIERDGSPFRGLEPFDASHSRVYFGRDRKVARATNELLAARARDNGVPFLLVVGPSGSGKSSLVRAGLVPLLTGGNTVGEVDAWRVAVMKPTGAGSAAFAALAQALFVDGSEESDRGGFGPALPELAAAGHGSATELAAALEQAPTDGAAPLLAALELAAASEQTAGGFNRAVRVDLLLVCDQLEDIFAEDVHDPGRIAFARLLTALVKSGRIWVVATLRADLYSSMLDQTSPFLALKDSGGLYDLASPGPAELQEILEKSAAAAGIVYGTDPTTGERLDERLLADATGSDALPLLQFSLQELFNARQVIDTPEGRAVQLTFAAYEKLERMDGAINKVAEDSIRKGPADLSGGAINEALARLLRHMVIRIGQVQDAAVGAQPGLTMRPMPVADATAEATSRTLVDLLVRARLLVLISGAGDLPLVRFAHERVLSSWRRAREIVEAHSEYFRIRADMEAQHERWETGKHRGEFLLRGMPLTEARMVARDFGNELPAGLRSFVTASARRDRWRQRITVGLTTTFATLAVVASVFAILAYSAQQRAAGNFEAAREAADHLVLAIPQGLRQQRGVSIPTLNVAFSAVEQMLQKMQDAVTHRDPGVFGRLETAVAGAQRLLPGRQGGNDLALLERSRANLYYEFAETYHQAGQGEAEARAKALASLQIRERLRAASGPDPELELGIARSQIELGDLDRKRLDAQKSADYAPVRDRLERAAASLENIDEHATVHAEAQYWLGQVLTRLGDIDRKTGALEQAERDYADAQGFAMSVYRAAPDNPNAVRELAWSYRKLAEMRTAHDDHDGAGRILETEVCVRRRSVAMKPDDLLRTADLGFALAMLANSLLRQHWQDDAARDAVYEALHRRIALADGDRSTPGYYTQVAASLTQSSTLHRLRGEPARGDPFAQAAADVLARVKEAFMPESELPRDGVARTFAIRNAARLKQNGVLAMIQQPARTIVENAESEFALLRLPQLEAAAAACWDRFVTKEASARGQP